MLLTFWEVFLWSDSASFVLFINGLSCSRLHFPVLVEESSEAGVLFFLLQSEEARPPNKSAAVILASVPWPQQLLLQHIERERENSRKGWGQCQPIISVLPALNEVNSNHPYAFKKVEKNRCYSTNSSSINHCPEWLSLQTAFLKLMFWYLLGFLVCSVSEFQQVKDNKFLSLAQLVINSTKKSFSIALPLIASLKGL